MATNNYQIGENNGKKLILIDTDTRDSNKIQQISGYYPEIWLSLKITEMSEFSVMHNVGRMA